MKPDSAEAIASLRQGGVRTLMVTGDNAQYDMAYVVMAYIVMAYGGDWRQRTVRHV